MVWSFWITTSMFTPGVGGTTKKINDTWMSLTRNDYQEDLEQLHAKIVSADTRAGISSIVISRDPERQTVPSNWVMISRVATKVHRYCPL
ncbi:hypothetical protein CTAM01_10546 [Colletotrichum tamarilloi]|uniref:Uncharacterized protein n=1 Tax=Colletotrichum tamarilloi TaxID=1209934 RepID=A0ABQ9R0I6_9PEZI|nr:uncharacterized protein CTAM01_10546 [Colletotrichum tamarilloi]KAK1490836.1 hypothetical protein CTAM01_10546 [Colletotrichum tamarilloi]